MLLGFKTVLKSVEVYTKPTLEHLPGKNKIINELIYVFAYILFG